jgi:hypothetical protein
MLLAFDGGILRVGRRGFKVWAEEWVEEWVDRWDGWMV